MQARVPHITSAPDDAASFGATRSPDALSRALARAPSIPTMPTLETLLPPSPPPAVLSHTTALAIVAIIVSSGFFRLYSIVVFYFRRLLVELAILRKHLSFITLTDRGGSWFSVQCELWNLLRLEANHQLHPLRVARMKQPLCSPATSMPSSPPSRRRR